jgi:prolipoprotein diacylglyceryl transferase
MFNFLYWDPQKEIFDFSLPLLGRPILWYGFLFALGFVLGYLVLLYLIRFLSGSASYSQKTKKAYSQLAERIAISVILGAVIGARLGDVIFYQSWEEIIRHPLSVIEIWKGGLASHGGAVGILIALFILSRRLKKDFQEISFLRLLDLVCIPAALAGVFIRLGNFVNQEILGIPSAVPWAVIFGHPADGSLPRPRHPVQLYEAGFYLLVFLFLLLIGKWWGKKVGTISGSFFFFVFTFRFLIVFIKEEQSEWMSSSYLTMGQYLSLPFIALGIYLLFRAKDQMPTRISVKGN